MSATRNESSVVKLAKKWYDDWDVARKVALGHIERAEGVWGWLEVVDDVELVVGGQASAFALRCKHCHTGCQTGNPYKWWRDHKESKKCRKARQDTAAGPSSGNTKLGQRQGTIAIRPRTYAAVGDVQFVFSEYPTVSNLQRLCPCAALLLFVIALQARVSRHYMEQSPLQLSKRNLIS